MQCARAMFSSVACPVPKYVLCTLSYKWYGPKYEDGEWKIRTNQELDNLNKGEKYSKMDKGAKDKLAGSTGESGGG